MPVSNPISVELKDQAKRVAEAASSRLAMLLAIVTVANVFCSPAVAQTEPVADGAVKPASWQIGITATGGFVPYYRVHGPGSYEAIDLRFFSAGVEIGRLAGSQRGSGVLRGRGEAMLEFAPFWVADYPKQWTVLYYTQYPRTTVPGYWGPARRYGASVTPVLFRWNFERGPGQRFVPWAQFGGGLLWTNHKFPLLGRGTSVINFMPQIDVGGNLFVRKGQSLEFAVKAVHISNAGLGDHNPGLNLTLQFSVGYSWWK